MRYILNITVLYFLIHCISSCEPKCNNDPNHFKYLFEVPVSILPKKDTFYIGDTITIQSFFSDSVYERGTGDYFNLINWDIKFRGGLVKMDTINPNWEDGTLHSLSPWVEVILDTDTYDYELFNYSDGGNSLLGNYKKIDDSYRIEYKIVPLETGTYFLGNVAELDDTKQHFEGKCKDISHSGFITIANEGNNNEYLLYTSPDEHFNTWVPEKIDDRFRYGGGYCFVVVE